MAKQQVAKNEPQKVPYVTPRILTLKVDLSLASAPSSKWLPVQASPKPQAEVRQACSDDLQKM